MKPKVCVIILMYNTVSKLDKNLAELNTARPNVKLIRNFLSDKGKWCYCGKN